MIERELPQLVESLPSAFRQRQGSTTTPPRPRSGAVPEFDVIRVQGRRSSAELADVDPLFSDVAGAGTRTFENSLEEVSHAGWEAVAWYCPFHFQPYRENWGIYVREDAIWGLVHRLHPANTSTRAQLFAWLFDSTVAHERFHFRAETFATIAEGVQGKGCYLPYHDQIYLKTWGSAECVEEGLATAVGIRSCETKTARLLLGELFSFAPPGYSDFGNYLSPANYLHGLKALAGQILERASVPSRVSRYFVGSFSVASVRQVPIYILRPAPLDFLPPEDVYRLSPPKPHAVERACRKLGGRIVHDGRHGRYCEFEKGRVPLSTDFDARRLVGQFRDKSRRPHGEVLDAFGIRVRTRPKSISRNS